MMAQSHNRNAVFAILVLAALFAAVLAGAHGSRNPFGDSSKRADSEKTEKNAVGQGHPTSDNTPTITSGWDRFSPA